MRHLLLYAGAFVIAVVFYLLQQALRTSFYPFVMPPLTPALLDAFFVVIYGLCGLVMFGALAEYGWRLREKRRLSKPRMVLALKPTETIRTKTAQTAPKNNVFY